MTAQVIDLLGWRDHVAKRDAVARRPSDDEGVVTRCGHRTFRPLVDALEEYRGTSTDRNWIVAGERFDLDLDAVEPWLAE